jgi:hypothetical protein
MRWGRVLGFAVLSAVALQWTAGSQTHAETRSEARPPLARSVAYEPTAAVNRILRNTSVGFSLSIPRGWKLTGQVVATEFAAGAACQSARVVDFQPPPGSGPGAKMLQSFVQICWKRVRDGSSLDEFMRKTYGRRLSELFRQASVAATRAYSTKVVNGSTTIFLQTPTYRLQIAAAAVARSAKRDERLAQVQRVLASLVLRR